VNASVVGEVMDNHRSEHRRESKRMSLQSPEEDAVTTPVVRFLERLEGVRRSGGGWSARCPAHDDRNSSLSVGEGEDGNVLVRCFAGCSVEAIVASVGLELRDLFPGVGEGVGDLPRAAATGQQSHGLTLEEYAAAK